MHYPIFYFQCLSGISGDMTVAALLDLGADASVLQKGLESLHIDGYTIEISSVTKCGISACDFHVHLEPENTVEAHHHHEHHHEQHHHEQHPHEHHHHKHHHEHSHRTLSDILPIIDQSAITPSAKALAKKIFHKQRQKRIICLRKKSIFMKLEPLTPL